MKLKYIFIIIIFFQSTFKIKSQSTIEERIRFEEEQFEKFKKNISQKKVLLITHLEENINSFCEKKNCIFKLERKLSFDYQHHFWSFLSFSNFFLEDFSIITRNDTVIALKHFYSIGDEILIFDSLKINHLIKQHENLVGKSRLEIDDLLPLEIYEYGNFCSVAGSPPDKAYEMLDLVKSKNKDQLVNWLKSINPEIQTYAVEGLFFLRKKFKIKLNEKEKELVDYILKKNSTLIACSGCTPVYNKKIQEELSKKKLKRKFKAYKKTGYLK